MRVSVLIAILIMVSGFSAAIPLGGIASCVNITTNGSYFLLANLSGSPNPNVAIAGTASCIRITSPNVALDCMGFNITNQTNLSVPSGAIVVDRLPPSAPLSNITVKNCVISGYDVGIAASVVSNSLFQNNTVWNGTLYGIGYGTSSLNSTFIGNTVHDISRTPGFFYGGLPPNQGFFLSNSANGTFINNTAYGNLDEGFHVETGSVSNSFTSNSAYGNGGNGFGVHSSSFNNFTNNTAYGNAGQGFLLNLSGNLILTGNSAHDNTNSGFSFDVSSSDNLILNNTAYNNSRGFNFYSNSGNNLTNNTAFSNRGPGFFDGGFYLDSSSDNRLLGNVAYDDHVGIFLTGSDNNLVQNSEIFRTVEGFRLQDGSDNNTIYNNTLYNHTDGCVFLLSSSSNKLASNHVYNCPNTGITVSFENGDVISDNHVHNTGPSWTILLQFVSYSAVSGNIIHDNPASGMLVFNSFLDNISSNAIYSNGGDGMTLNDANNNLFSNNDIHDNLGHGINGQSSSYNNVSGSLIYDNNRDGVLFTDSFSIFSHNRIFNNTVSGNGWNGIELIRTDNNTVLDNTVFGNGLNGIVLNPAVGSVFIPFAPSPGSARLDTASLTPLPPPPPTLSGSDNNSVIANDVYDNTLDGILLNASSRNIVKDNDARDNGRNGIALVPGSASSIVSTAAGRGASLSPASFITLPPPVVTPSSTFRTSDFNQIRGNLAHGNLANGILLNTSSNNSLVDNDAYSNGNDGFLLRDENLTNSSGGSSVCGNFICESGESISCPFDCAPPASHNNLSLNTAYDNGRHGFEINTTDNNSLIDNTAYGNELAGFMLDSAPDSVFIRNLAYGNEFGFYETGATINAATITNSSFHDNDWEITEKGPGLILLDGNPGFQIINSKLGNSSVNISLNDELVGGGFQINETVAPGQAPAGRVPFHNKYLKVNFTGELELQTLAFHWNNTEASGFDETQIRIFTWNGTGWEQNPTQSTNALANTATADFLANITADDIYGLFTILNDGGSDNPPPPPSPLPPPPPPPECTEDSDCAASEQCSSGSCEAVPCQCGTVQDHQCVSFECCSDSQCPAGKMCEGHECRDKPECTTDLQCDPDQFCNIPPGQNGGSCKDLCEDGGSECKCSEAVDHKLVPTGFECGFPGCPACPSGSQCVNNHCILYNLTGPPTVVVNSTATVHASNSTDPCALCDVRITDPAGKAFTGKTDDEGDLTFPAPLKGIYNVTLLIKGAPYKSILVNALPRATPVEEPKPTERAPSEEFPWWLLILLLILVLGFLYWRRKKEKKAK